MDKDRKAIIDRRAKGRAEVLGKDKGKLTKTKIICKLMIKPVIQMKINM